MLPANRVRDSRGLSESDWSKTHARVYLPRFNGGYVKAWVKITSGSHLSGKGIVDDKVDSPVVLGTPIVYDGGTESGVLPKFVKKQHRANAKNVLLEGVAKRLAGSMTIKITASNERRSRTFVSMATIQRHSGVQNA